ncbi:MAG TPA: TlpA disulfide reductase family protein [Candidatus Sumerlaeota bacterium]|nr:TlpA disulfide reductase family protein [Candidatus Sumerlaeota bacterium]HMZ52001.1 TlpA disulfide reductase family protein [Candidatus Sumerlaeota bacterium]
MKHLLSILLFTIFLAAAGTSHAAPPPAPGAKDSPTTGTLTFPAAGELPMLQSIKDIQAVTTGHGSDLLVVNFWATFCAPCVEEMPYFVQLSQKYPEKRVRVVGLTVDLKSQVESVVKPFLKEKGIPYANFHLYADDQGDVIKFFSKDWDGALPVTFFYDKSGNQIGHFLEPVTAEQLNGEVEKLLKQIDEKK